MTKKRKNEEVKESPTKKKIRSESPWVNFVSRPNDDEEKSLVENGDDSDSSVFEIGDLQDYNLKDHKSERKQEEREREQRQAETQTYNYNLGMLGDRTRRNDDGSIHIRENNDTDSDEEEFERPEGVRGFQINVGNLRGWVRPLLHHLSPDEIEVPLAPRRRRQLYSVAQKAREKKERARERKEAKARERKEAKEKRFTEAVKNIRGMRGQKA